MAFVAVNQNETEGIFYLPPERAFAGKESTGVWNSDYDMIELPKGSIKKLIGRTLTWADDPVELKEEEEG